jgi:hypothetical protein
MKLSCFVLSRNDRRRVPSHRPRSPAVSFRCTLALHATPRRRAKAYMRARLWQPASWPSAAEHFPVCFGPYFAKVGTAYFAKVVLHYGFGTTLCGFRITRDQPCAMCEPMSERANEPASKPLGK